MAEPLPSCVTCGSARTGSYCAACGQRERSHRLTVRSVAAEALQHVTSFDRGFGRTLLDLIRRPAGVATDYWRGRTVPYAGPGRYFLVAISVVQIAVFVLGLAPDFVESFAEGFNEARRTGAEAISTETLLQRIQRFWVVGLAGLVPVVVLWSRLFFRRAGRTLAEHVVAHLYFLGTFVLVLGVSIIVGGWIYEYLFEWLGYAFEILTLVGGFGLYAWSVARTFGARVWTGLVGGSALVLLGILTYIAVVAFVAGALGAHG